MGERVMNDLSEDILQLEDKINSSDDEREATNAFLAEMRNGNTVRKTKSVVGKFKNWLLQQNEEREVEGNAKSLSNTVFLNNSMYFGMRSRTEHEHLRWGDVELKTTSSGEQYLEYSERATKTRTGVNSDSRAFPPKMFEDKGNQRCPIQMYMLYAQKRPLNMKGDEAKFYVGINNKASSGEWFKNMAMGKNTIAKIVKTMAEEGGIEGRKVNHSARKTYF
ncbi:unnamed protein product [Mytilus coruscus]|uniref:ZMYM2-like/QRICH1 C-terminal domain-containing protein n=1 Tax=Mytilus coruscus TaxID=42192 RepID=A0A6J8B5I9_MYTCO|nr:unnamed protein product [Mytilus coruscus]